MEAMCRGWVGDDSKGVGWRLREGDKGGQIMKDTGLGVKNVNSFFCLLVLVLFIGLFVCVV